MNPINSYPMTNEELLYLREKYSLTEEYEKAYPEDFLKVLLLVQSQEELIQSSKERNESNEKLFKKIDELMESNIELHAQAKEMAELEKQNTQALQKLAKTALEIEAITSNMANVVSICADRIFHPIRNGLQNGFYFLTGQREPAVILPKENRLAIEYNPEDTISHADPINPSSIDEKKKWVNLLKFCMVVGGLSLLYARAQRILCYLSAKE